MITVSGIFYGLVAAVIGTLFLIYTFQLVGFTGRQDWIERYLGAGSTYLAYKIFGLLLVFGGILSVTGLLHGFLTGLFAPLHHFFTRSG